MNQIFLMLTVPVLLLVGCAGCGVGNGFNSNRTLYLNVIKRVANREIKTVEEKDIKLPEGSTELPASAQLPSDLSAASVDGEIYVSRPSNDQFLVVFKTWRGKGFNMEGYLYAAKPLSHTEMTKDYYGHSVVVIGSMELVLEKQLEPNWYRVSYKLD